MSKTTQKHFRHFCKMVNKYLEKYRIGAWEVYFKKEDLSKSYSQVRINRAGRVVSFVLCNVWNDGQELNEKNIEDTAKHEVLHLLTCPLAILGGERYTTEDEIDYEWEVLVQHLMDIL